MPEVEIPGAIAGVSGRIFSLIYEAHNRMKSLSRSNVQPKEIEIFRDVGLHPVFFGET